MKKEKRILFLYRELADYFVQSVNCLCDDYDTRADVIAYPVNSDAPFQFQFSDRVCPLKRTDFDVDSLCKLILKENYDLVFVGGWADKDYLKAIGKSKHSNTVLAFDTWWSSGLKMQLSAWYAKWFIKPLFRNAFVPGHHQKLLALKMGFHEPDIITGVYSAHVSKFSRLHIEPSIQQNGTKKKLMYVGRYATEKFIDELQNTFMELVHEGEQQWQLICAGTGPLFDRRMIHPSITHLGFLQPMQLMKTMKTADAFILPSTFEPWGVVAHEFAAAGLPLVLSSSVGAAEAFLDDEQNGFAFRSGDRNDLKAKLKLLFAKSDHELKRMGKKSFELAQKITPDTWAKSLYQLMQ